MIWEAISTRKHIWVYIWIGEQMLQKENVEKKKKLFECADNYNTTWCTNQLLQQLKSTILLSGVMPLL